jgi:hypothetical protein
MSCTVNLETLSSQTISEIDEALRHLSLVPVEERGPAWYAYMDAILEQRNGMENA